jgi:sulfur-carrier protein adenylyltransferase/sulfurtransferase
MDRRYSILAIVLIVAAAGLLIVPDRGENKEMKPEKLLAALNDQARFLSTDDITERIIGGDPILQLIDVRPAEQFSKFALPGAINIPTDSILNTSFQDVLHKAGKDNVFYSNGDVEADAAWQLCSRAGIRKVFVMKGGLNQWYNTIIKGAKPSNTASSGDLDTYNFRQAAKLYFTGGSPAVEKRTYINEDVPNINEEVPKPVKVNVVKKTPGKSSGGGC